ncbi:four helix bundle protein [Coraliomargarita parva]|uniref:four helix bundle protein n=1 Tax=Coraliomargarita parva TaxID=3014050 RepID=UPI0022B3878A|nr:four helix bundle protein [Coraliomargarita parva]
MIKPQFDHEKLAVYQRALDFVEIADLIIEGQAKRLSVVDQLDRASTSIPLNIAEGNGKFTPPDRCRFHDIARGSALECAAALDVLVRKKRLDVKDAERGKAVLVEIVSMLVGLIRSQSQDRAYETPATYGAVGD